MTYAVLSEPTTFAVRPGGKIYLDNALATGDSVDLSIDWGAWLSTSGETASSVAWDAESGITVSGSSVATPITSCTLTAAQNTGTFKVECKMTTSGAQIRSVVLYVEVEDLR